MYVLKLITATTQEKKKPYDQTLLFSGYMYLGMFTNISAVKFCLHFTSLITVLQYGFITIFVVAFPLAPLFAMIRNCFKIRCDAYQLLHKMHRPVPERSMDIGKEIGSIPLKLKLNYLMLCCA